MANVTLLCFFLLAVSLVSVTSFRTIRSMEELQKTEFGRVYPRHGLRLLYWFCHEYISFDNNNNMIPVTDPGEGAYGFHWYGNKEKLLRRGYIYYTVGNLLDNVNSPAHERLPKYVFENFYSSKDSHERDQNNRDRIIVRMHLDDYIDRVYITQHYEYGTGGSNYDPKNTYRISRDLIRDIRNTPYEEFFDD